MNKYLEKIAEQEEAGGHKGAAAGWAGLSGAYIHGAHANGYFDGRTTLYHGTSENRAENILRDGLIPKKEKGPAWAAMKGADDIEKGLAFMTPVKPYAQFYANLSHGIEEGKVKEGVGVEALAEHLRFKNKQGKVLKARVPLHQHEVVQNPLTETDPTRHIEKSIKGGVDAKYFTDSEHYTRATGKEILKHIKANPKQFAAGVGIPAAGLAAAYYKWNEK